MQSPEAMVNEAEGSPELLSPAAKDILVGLPALHAEIMSLAGEGLTDSFGKTHTPAELWLKACGYLFDFGVTSENQLTSANNFKKTVLDFATKFLQQFKNLTPAEAQEIIRQAADY